MFCIPPPRPRLLVYQTSMVSDANPCTSTQYDCPACSVGLILEVYEVTAGCEELGRFETCHDSSTVPGTPLDVLFIRGLKVIEHGIVVASKEEARAAFKKMKCDDEIDAVVLFSGTWVWAAHMVGAIRDYCAG